MLEAILSCKLAVKFLAMFQASHQGVKQQYDMAAIVETVVHDFNLCLQKGHEYMLGIELSSVAYIDDGSSTSVAEVHQTKTYLRNILKTCMTLPKEFHAVAIDALAQPVSMSSIVASKHSMTTHSMFGQHASIKAHVHDDDIVAMCCAQEHMYVNTTSLHFITPNAEQFRSQRQDKLLDWDRFIAIHKTLPL